jgi:hypothetical protein
MYCETAKFILQISDGSLSRSIGSESVLPEYISPALQVIHRPVQRIASDSDVTVSAKIGASHHLDRIAGKI